MFEKEAETFTDSKNSFWRQGRTCIDSVKQAFQEGAEFGYNKANEWHYVKDGGLPRQEGHTCFSVDVLTDDKRFVYYCYSNGKWYTKRNAETKVNAWREVIFPEETGT